MNEESLDSGDTKCFTERNTTADARSRERERRETEKRRMKGIREKVRGVREVENATADAMGRDGERTMLQSCLCLPWAPIEDFVEDWL